MEVEISNEVELIRKDLYTKLNGMLNALRDHQTSQQADLKVIAETLVNLTVKEVNELATILKEVVLRDLVVVVVRPAAGVGIEACGQGHHESD